MSRSRVFSILDLKRLRAYFFMIGRGVAFCSRRTACHLSTRKHQSSCLKHSLTQFWIGILHRDASDNNVLMGVDDTKGNTEDNNEGNRGILIDLDMAIWTNREESSKTDKRTGTRMFQSMKILKGTNIPHNHLDDLESFFYILLLIVLKRKGPAGAPNELCPSFFEGWSNPKASTSYAYKCSVLSLFESEVLDNIPEGWAQPIKTLLSNLRDFIWKHATTKPPQPPPGAKTVAALNPNADEHYKEFVGHIEGALEALSTTPSKDKSSTANPPPTTVGPSDSILPDPASPSPLSGATALQTPTRPLQGSVPATSTPLPLSRRKATSAQSPLSISTVFPSMAAFDHIRGTKRSNDNNPQTPAKRSKLSGISGVSPTRSPGNGPPSPRKDFTPSPVDNMASDDVNADSFFQGPASASHGPGSLFGGQREHSASASSTRRRNRNSLTRQKSLDKNHSRSQT
ncbi:hypothetical protein BDN72DRAFT_848445 [Pluteus cervinus]|uniref:Uncharacterized protein n=1 Tax=Pluteus cervinus TaxID=181527 RepID=A0ACD3A9V5_9AGAR|nr:hypothetical protein BDN72DRAFT_848445 [Pluteus cervinus]